MRIVLFRHGLAVDRDEAQKKKIDDAMRPLVEKGKIKSLKVAKLLKAYEPRFDLLVSSPLLRAQQTADVVSRVLTYGRYAESFELAPETPPHAFARWLQSEASQCSSVLVVGHEPQLSSFASWCLAGTDDSFIDLKKSGVICLNLESAEAVGPKCAELKWMIHPKLLD